MLSGKCRFNWVALRIGVHSNETPERFAKLAKNVEYRCPVMNLFRSADVEVRAEWGLVPGADRSQYQGGPPCSPEPSPS